MQTVNNISLRTLLILTLKSKHGSTRTETLTVSVSENDCKMHYHIIERKDFINKLPLFLTNSDGDTLDCVINEIRRSSSIDIIEYHFSPALNNASKVKTALAEGRNVETAWAYLVDKQFFAFMDNDKLDGLAKLVVQELKTNPVSASKGVIGKFTGTDDAMECIIARLIRTKVMAA